MNTLWKRENMREQGNSWEDVQECFHQHTSTSEQSTSEQTETKGVK